MKIEMENKRKLGRPFRNGSIMHCTLCWPCYSLFSMCFPYVCDVVMRLALSLYYTMCFLVVLDKIHI